MNYTNTKFTIKEVNPLTKMELNNLPDPTYRKVPILLVKQSAGNDREQEQINPTSKDDPHLGDLSIYGVLKGLRGLPILDDICGAFPSIDAWYQRMENRVEKS